MVINTREIRLELGLSQGDLAALLGVSKRAVQSYEQKWRRPSEMVERALMLVLLARRNGAEFSAKRCWEHKECLPEIRSRCAAYVSRQGHLCWFLTGTLCEGQTMKTWKAKWAQCIECDFCHSLLAGVAEAFDDTSRLGRASIRQD